MNKLLATALISFFLALVVIYAMLPVEAAVTTKPAISPSLNPIVAVDLSMPPPQEPLDTTPITPVETVGAAPFEPF